MLLDRDKRRGVLIRDRLGIKPLYYAIAGDVVVFGSELKCVLASGSSATSWIPTRSPPTDARLRPRRDDAAARRAQARGRRAARGVERSARLERWWDYPAPAADAPLSAEEWAEIVLDKLDESVRLRLMSDVPLGAMLSGGLDSSLIVALMARHMSEPVKTFAVGFAGEDSELPDARRVADAFGADHHELELDTEASPTI